MAAGMTKICVEIPNDILDRLRKLCSCKGERSKFIRDGIAYVVLREERKRLFLNRLMADDLHIE